MSVGLDFYCKQCGGLTASRSEVCTSCRSTPTVPPPEVQSPQLTVEEEARKYSENTSSGLHGYKGFLAGASSGARREWEAGASEKLEMRESFKHELNAKDARIKELEKTKGMMEIAYKAEAKAGEIAEAQLSTLRAALEKAEREREELKGANHAAVTQWRKAESENTALKERVQKLEFGLRVAVTAMAGHVEKWVPHLDSEHQLKIALDNARALLPGAEKEGK